MLIDPSRAVRRAATSRSRRVNGKWFVSRVILLAAAVPGFARAEYREVAVEDGGAITGKVSFHGELHEDAIEPYPVSGKWPGCGTGYRTINTIDARDGALRGTFILLDGITKGKKWPELGSPAELDQQQCEFVPTHQVVRKGSSMILRNSDSGVVHNVNMREIIEVPGGREVRRMLFNVAQPTVGEVEQEIEPRSSALLTVGCDLHNWMFAYVVAPEHPYAVLVDEDGTFRLDDVPPGVHSVMAWHPKLGTKKLSVTVPTGGDVQANFDYGN